MTNPASHRSRRRRLAAASAAALVLFVPAAGSASIGAGIGANPIRLAGRAEPGGRYHLPSLYVVNTGTKAAEYRVRIERLGDAPGRDVPASWVRFARTRLRLRPHRSAIVPVTLVLPSQAAHGSYRSNVVLGTWTRRPADRRRAAERRTPRGRTSGRTASRNGAIGGHTRYSDLTSLSRFRA